MKGPVVSRRRILGLSAALGILLLGGGLAVREAWDTGRALSSRERRTVEALAEAVFPGGPGPAGNTVGAADFLDRYLRETALPRDARLVRALLFALEWGALLAGSATFSHLPLQRRQAYLAAWEAYRSPLARVAFTGIKTLLCMAYLEHPAAREAFGIARLCEERG